MLGIHYGDLKRYNFSLISFLFKFWQTLIHFVDPKRDNIFLMSSVFKFWEFDVINVLESKSSVLWAYMSTSNFIKTMLQMGMTSGHKIYFTLNPKLSTGTGKGSELLSTLSTEQAATISSFRRAPSPSALPTQTKDQHHHHTQASVKDNHMMKCFCTQKNTKGATRNIVLDNACCALLLQNIN